MSSVLRPVRKRKKVRTLGPDRSPFQGDRKVHARLRILDGIRVARTSSTGRNTPNWTSTPRWS